jgi:hypothetical protein
MTRLQGFLSGPRACGVAGDDQAAGKLVGGAVVARPMLAEMIAATGSRSGGGADRPDGGSAARSLVMLRRVAVGR